jgi:hypothetical protein
MATGYHQSCVRCGKSAVRNIYLQSDLPGYPIITYPLCEECGKVAKKKMFEAVGDTRAHELVYGVNEN